MYSQAFIAAALAALAPIAHGQVIVQPSPTGALASSIYYSCLLSATGAPGAPGAPVIDFDVNVYVEVFVEVYVQTFLNICAGGPCNQDYNVTQTCTRDVPCTRPAVPEGFTVMVRDCGCKESTMDTVTEPCDTFGPVVTGVPMMPGQTGGGAQQGGAGKGGPGGAGGQGGSGNSAAAAPGGSSGAMNAAGVAGGSNNAATPGQASGQADAQAGAQVGGQIGVAVATGGAVQQTGTDMPVFTGGAAAMSISAGLMLAVAGVMLAL